jgi:hypothetical protein
MSKAKLEWGPHQSNCFFNVFRRNFGDPDGFRRNYPGCADPRDGCKCNQCCQSNDDGAYFDVITGMKADLENTKNALTWTQKELKAAQDTIKVMRKTFKEDMGHSAYKRSQIANVIVQLRIELNEVKECCRDKLKEKAQSKKAASEAAFAALSASKYITLRLLMF